MKQQLSHQGKIQYRKMAYSKLFTEEMLGKKRLGYKGRRVEIGQEKDWNLCEKEKLGDSSSIAKLE